MRWTILFACALLPAISAEPANAYVARFNGTPLDPDTIGLTNGAVITAKCDYASEATWLRGNVVGQDVGVGTFGAAIDTPSRWLVERIGTTPWFRLKALGQGTAPGARFLALRPANARVGPEPYLSADGNTGTAVFQIYALLDQFGGHHYYGLRGLSYKFSSQSKFVWLKCAPGSGDVYTDPTLGTGSVVAWRIYIERPGR